MLFFVFYFSTLGRTSIITGRTSWLSVTRVTTVSVSVLLVIVSVTLPMLVGAGGKFKSPDRVSGCLIVTVTEGPCCWEFMLLFEFAWLMSGEGEDADVGGRRKWAGIMAWKSSLVMGFGTWISVDSCCCCSWCCCCCCCCWIVDPPRWGGSGGAPLGGLMLCLGAGWGCCCGCCCWGLLDVSSTPFILGSPLTEGWSPGLLGDVRDDLEPGEGDFRALSESIDRR